MRRLLWAVALAPVILSAQVSAQTTPSPGEIHVAVFAEPGHTPLPDVSLALKLRDGNEEDLLEYLRELAAARGITYTRIPGSDVILVTSNASTTSEPTPDSTVSKVSLTANADSDGQAIFRNLQPGKYEISAGANGYTEQAVTEIRIDPVNPIAEVSIALIRLPTVAGRVRGANGEPVPGATVVLLLVSGKPIPRIVTRNAAGVTNAAGEYTLTASTTGEFVIGVEETGSDNARPLTLDAGARLTNVDFQLP